MVITSWWRRNDGKVICISFNLVWFALNHRGGEREDRRNGAGTISLQASIWLLKDLYLQCDHLSVLQPAWPDPGLYLANCLLTVFAFTMQSNSQMHKTIIVGRTPLNIGATYTLHKHHPRDTIYIALVLQKFLNDLLTVYVVNLHWLSCKVYCACMHTIYTIFY